MAEPQFDYETSDSVEHLRVPPHSLQAEQSVLGGLMLDNECWDTVAEKSSVETLCLQMHRAVTPGWQPPKSRSKCLAKIAIPSKRRRTQTSLPR